MENQVKQVICGEDHTFIIDQDHNAYACGDNSKGQLGIGHSWDVEHPTLIIELKGKVKTIRSTGDINIEISTEITSSNLFTYCMIVQYCHYFR